MNLQQLSGTKTVLIVDDEPGILEVVSYCLELKGVSVSTASSGKQALEMIEASETAYDLIISDIYMPFMNGWSLIQKISNLLPQSECPPVVVMTGYAELERECLEDPGLSSLIAGTLSKPFSKNQLYEVVEDILKFSCHGLTQVS